MASRKYGLAIDDLTNRIRAAAAQPPGQAVASLRDIAAALEQARNTINDLFSTVVNSADSYATLGTGGTIPLSMLPAHAATHQNGGADEVATATAAANAIPKAGSGGKLDLGWTVTGTPTSGGVPYFSSGSAMSSSGALTANRIVLGGGAGAAPTVLGAGTSTTVLHGNASGAPTFGAVSLTADISGTLPIGNGGTGQTTAAAAFSALAPTPTWTTISTFTGGWGSTLTGTYGTPSYTKDPLGNVITCGAATGGSDATTVFTLPAGYRPTGRNIAMVVSAFTGGGATVSATLVAQTDGAVVCYGISAGWGIHLTLRFPTF